jgi:hypothetical protein
MSGFQFATDIGPHGTARRFKIERDDVFMWEWTRGEWIPAATAYSPREIIGYLIRWITSRESVIAEADFLDHNEPSEPEDAIFFGAHASDIRFLPHIAALFEEKVIHVTDLEPHERTLEQ